ncbi:TIGR02680 family protein [Lentzea albidocapillata]|uniref:TIGR02680 family protein n=1 Tax=Lentzea albidocapillata TaxID=40571 RepID=A0A1W2FJI2_9PSEU|nr:TIGR02680 family protein [Lentzea albidocapillata]SMD22101.1 TIGR02680 family protein [Lentzea albidocapillata]
MSRWRLHRGGVVNIWQYTEQTFDFSGGRAIFQGTNGSGKSRTLELLLPLCLDGDLRQVGSKGFDTVSLRRLMLDDYDGGPNRIGYTWVELIREAADHSGNEYLTCGLGVKASKTSQAITDSWRFVTPMRVGTELQLAGAERVPHGPAQLRDLIGADCMFEEPAFRAKIAETVYGVPAARYGDLLHLQRTLRNPDVGLKVLEGQLEQILSDALPPLDQVMVEQLATSFDDLESIRENIVRLSSADSALGTFLKTYSDYAFGGLRSAAERLEAAEKSVAKLQREQSKLTQELDLTRMERAAAEQALTDMETGEQQAEETIAALKELPAFRDLQDLKTRENLVAEKRSSAVAALETAHRQRAQEEAAVDNVLRLLRRLAEDLQAADALSEPLRENLRLAGMDPDLAPDVPQVPAAEATVTTASVRAKPDPEAGPLPIERRVPPAAATEDVLAALTSVIDQTSGIASLARQRGALALALHEQALALDSQQREVESLRQKARDAQLGATDATSLRNQEMQELAEVVQAWLEQVEVWTSSGPLLDERPAEALKLPQTADPAAARTLSTTAREWAAPLVQTARDAAHAFTQQRAGLRARLDTLDEELVGLRSGDERVPVPGQYTSADRDSAAGAPFYRLVDFVPTLTDDERAGLEAALQASGLLDAWVTPADADLSDVLAVPRPAVDGRSLADYLVPAVEGSPVPETFVADLLKAVSLDDMTTTGDWRTGVLTGRWTKPEAEFIGAGAREAARGRRIAALEEELADLRDRLGTAEDELARAHEHVATWEAHLAAFPGDGELIAKHSRVQAAEESAARAQQRTFELREALENANSRLEAARGELTRQAGDADLSSGTEALRQAQAAAAEAQRTADLLGDAVKRRCQGTISDLTDASHRYHEAVADRQTAEADADSRCVDHAAQAGTLAELTDAVGGEAKEISEQLTQLERSRKKMRTDLKGVREGITTAREQAAKLEALLENNSTQVADASEALERAAGNFRATVRAPGLLAAAFPEVPEEALVRQAIAETPDRRGGTEATVIAKLQALQTSLAGSHDIAAEQHAGLLTVTVTGEEGAKPVAVAARQVTTKLAEQRGFLDERYQGIFADYLIRDLAEWLRNQITVAEDLTKRMNEVLGQARSSQGVHVKLAWKSSSALDDATRQALALVRLPFGERTPEQDATLRRVFTERIENERDTHTGGYAEILSRALDYRTWHQFTVTVADTGPDGSPRERRLRQLSSGETRLISYVTLFAAAASFYDAVSDEFDPLRLVLLDEAFERLDDPTIARMLGLLVDLDMDWVITWPSGWGVSDKIPRMHIFDVLRPKNGRGVACTQTTWDGAALDRVDP